MSNPLKKQVGGSHYQTAGVQHVTFCQRNRIPWCEACAVKYLMRHRKKNGKQDLEKAKHYLELLINEDYIQSQFEPIGLDPEKFHIPTFKLLEDNGVVGEEAEIIEMVLGHQKRHGESTLLNAIRRIDELIVSYDDLGLLD